MKTYFRNDKNWLGIADTEAQALAYRQVGFVSVSYREIRKFARTDVEQYEHHHQQIGNHWYTGRSTGYFTYTYGGPNCVCTSREFYYVLQGYKPVPKVPAPDSR